jgi:hypothetical protein
MKDQIAIIAAILLLASTTARAQSKVASYSFGTPGKANYEHLSFWVKDGKRTDSYYSYGPDRKEVRLKYIGKTQRNAKPEFKVQFANGHVLTIGASGNLLMVNATGQSPKSFAWEYEGPVNGIGTFCDVCAADEKEAMQLMRTYYLK